MKLAVATTTIHDCTRQLRWLEACDPDVPVFVAGDEQVPAIAWGNLPKNVRWLEIEKQQAFGYKCSPLLGTRTIERRNIAVLEALKWGAEAVIYSDTDNLPINSYYYGAFEDVLDRPFHGLEVHGRNGWFDPSRLLSPSTTQRGFPHQIESAWAIDPATNVNVGVASGMILGDPDVSAVERIANAPITHNMSELLRNGIVIDAETWTIFNTQNTAVLRKFVPAMLTCPQFGRYADIFSSLICQRVMREHGYAVHVGQPLVWQQRHDHDLVVDLQQEIFGMAHTIEFAGWLNSVRLTNVGIISQVGDLYHSLANWRYCPAGVPELAAAWLSDAEGVL